MFLFEHILLTTRFKWCDLEDVYCAIMLTMMIKITLVYNNKTYKVYKMYNNWCTTTKHTKCTTTKHKKCIMYCRNAYVSYFNSLVFNRVYRIT